MFIFTIFLVAFKWIFSLKLLYYLHRLGTRRLYCIILFYGSLQIGSPLLPTQQLPRHKCRNVGVPSMSWVHLA